MEVKPPRDRVMLHDYNICEEYLPTHPLGSEVMVVEYYVRTYMQLSFIHSLEGAADWITYRVIWKVVYS